ncbi:hypothetical protein PRK78_000514 [Emydomyces testavorans]|uniref:Uncharacterized protein n=1 Tax=Emydomyces testavorans TaxID=2070801 RepID=A0AAF0DBX0_9EURO|nr:hypothetical protein PRK78_000514 [Emydomyces testavorans]
MSRTLAPTKMDGLESMRTRAVIRSKLEMSLESWQSPWLDMNSLPTIGVTEAKIDSFVIGEAVIIAVGTIDVVFVAIEVVDDDDNDDVVVVIVEEPIDGDCTVTVEIMVSRTGGPGVCTVTTFGVSLSEVVGPPSTCTTEYATSLRSLGERTNGLEDSGSAFMKRAEMKPEATAVEQ